MVKDGKGRSLKLGLLCISPVLSLLGLLGTAAIRPVQEPQQTPAAAAAQPATATSKKPKNFPLNLFAQAKPDDYIDEAMCASCHADAHAAFQPSPHNPYVRDPHTPKDKQGCQSCHGPGGPHVAHLEQPEEIRDYILSYTKSTPLQSATGCLRCHNDTMTMVHWRRTGHAAGGVSCADCHSIHQDPQHRKPFETARKTAKGARIPIFIAAPPPRKLLKTDEATLCTSCHPKEGNEFRHNFHHPVPEGRLVCSDCHEIHPRRAAEKQTAAHTRLRPAKEMCVTCHAETAGPFVFEHDPVVGLTGEGCMECHRPHGSQNPKMLTTFSRGVCNQCHTEKANNHFPGRSCWQAGCHVAVHGSNRDPLLLQR